MDETEDQGVAESDPDTDQGREIQFGVRASREGVLDQQVGESNPILTP